jgi:hypothetical protein
VDPDSFSVHLTGAKANGQNFDLTLTCASSGVICTPLGTALDTPAARYGYAVTIDPSSFTAGDAFDHFAQNTTISVTINSATDYVGNVLSQFHWTFTTQDTTSPTINNIYPAINQPFCVDAASSSAQKSISFDVADAGVGVRQEDIIVRILDATYQFGAANSARLTFVGDANLWHVTINPLFDLASRVDPFAITIDLADQAGNRYQPTTLYALTLNCQGSPPLDPHVCQADGWCNPLCLHDPDCPGGTNCSPSSTTNPSCAPTSCPVSTCDGKNYESCSSCCPAISYPSYPNPQIIYRYRDLASAISDTLDVPAPAPATTASAITATSPYTFNSHPNDSLAPESSNWCRPPIHYFWPWLLVVILTGATLHQTYHRRRLQNQVTLLKSQLAGRRTS